MTMIRSGGDPRPGAPLPGVALVSRAWPSRSFLYAQLREAGLDVHGVEAVEDLEETLRGQPGRFGAVLMDAAGFSGSEAARAAASARSSGVPLFLAAGPWELGGGASGGAGVRILRKPVAVGAVVETIRAALAGRPAGG